MDRDRIVEDVGDMDDYFEYERPLDFVSRAERRKLLKEAQGDEERANQILLNRAVAGETTTTVVDVKPPNNDGSPPDFVEAILEAESPTGRTEEEEIEPEPELDLVDEELADEIERKASAELSQQLRGDNEKDLEMKPAADLAPVSPSQPEVAIEPIKKRTKSPKTSQPNASSSSSSKKKSVLDLDGLDELDMDAW